MLVALFDLCFRRSESVFGLVECLDLMNQYAWKWIGTKKMALCFVYRLTVFGEKSFRLLILDDVFLCHCSVLRDLCLVFVPLGWCDLCLLDRWWSYQIQLLNLRISCRVFSSVCVYIWIVAINKCQRLLYLIIWLVGNKCFTLKSGFWLQQVVRKSGYLSNYWFIDCLC